MAGAEGRIFYNDPAALRLAFSLYRGWLQTVEGIRQRDYTRHSARHFRGRRESQHGVSLFAHRWFPDDAVQCALGLVARKPGATGRENVAPIWAMVFGWAAVF